MKVLAGTGTCHKKTNHAVKPHKGHWNRTVQLCPFCWRQFHPAMNAGKWHAVYISELSRIRPRPWSIPIIERPVSIRHFLDSPGIFAHNGNTQATLRVIMEFLEWHLNAAWIGNERTKSLMHLLEHISQPTVTQTHFLPTVRKIQRTYSMVMPKYLCAMCRYIRGSLSLSSGAIQFTCYQRNAAKYIIMLSSMFIFCPTPERAYSFHIKEWIN